MFVRRRFKEYGLGAYAFVVAWFVAFSLPIYFWKDIHAFLAWSISLVLALICPDLPNMKKMLSLGRASKD